jgi:hypothetical protein
MFATLLNQGHSLPLLGPGVSKAQIMPIEINTGKCGLM